MGNQGFSSFPSKRGTSFAPKSLIEHESKKPAVLLPSLEQTAHVSPHKYLLNARHPQPGTQTVPAFELNTCDLIVI